MTKKLILVLATVLVIGSGIYVYLAKSSPEASSIIDKPKSTPVTEAVTPIAPMDPLASQRVSIVGKKVGDRLGDFTITNIDNRPDYLSVEFSGETTISGTIDDGVGIVCFRADDKSAPNLPLIQEYGRGGPSFCFSNPTVAQSELVHRDFGNPATIIIKHYWISVAEKETSDEAELVKVISN